MTHEYLSQVLRVRRASVTEAAGELQSLGGIENHRGRIKLKDRAVLEKASCECYEETVHLFDSCYS